MGVIIKAVDNSLQDFGENILKIFIGYLIYIGISLIPVSIPLIYAAIILATNPAPQFTAVFWFNFVSALIVTFVLGVIMRYGFLNFLISKKKKYSEIFNGVSKYWERALVQLLYIAGITILFGISILISFILIAVDNIVVEIIGVIWLLATITAGIVVGFLLYFWTQSIVIYDVTVLEGMRISYEKVKNNIGRTALLMIIIFLINLAVSIFSIEVGKPIIDALLLTIYLIASILATSYIEMLKLYACKLFK